MHVLHCVVNNITGICAATRRAWGALRAAQSDVTRPCAASIPTHLLESVFCYSKHQGPNPRRLTSTRPRRQFLSTPDLASPPASRVQGPKCSTYGSACQPRIQDATRTAPASTVRTRKDPHRHVSPHIITIHVARPGRCLHASCRLQDTIHNSPPSRRFISILILFAAFERLPLDARASTPPPRIPKSAFAPHPRPPSRAVIPFRGHTPSNAQPAAPRVRLADPSRSRHWP